MAPRRPGGGLQTLEGATLGFRRRRGGIMCGVAYASTWRRLPIWRMRRNTAAACLGGWGLPPGVAGQRASVWLRNARRVQAWPKGQQAEMKLRMRRRWGPLRSSTRRAARRARQARHLSLQHALPESFWARLLAQRSAHSFARSRSSCLHLHRGGTVRRCEFNLLCGGGRRSGGCAIGPR